MAPKFALFSYSTNNLGDEIQSIAARQFLPSVDLLIDRDHWTTTPPYTDGRFKIIMNGWFTHYPEKWPPPDILDPLLVSMHITQERSKQTVHPPASEALLSSSSLAYLKRNEPVGARDLWTATLLDQHGVGNYFSGCITLTLGDACARQRYPYICAIDLDDELYQRLVKVTRYPIMRVRHYDPSGGSFEQRCARASRLLSLYAYATCVITTRLHGALPSVAFGTPTLLVNVATDQYRMSGLRDLVSNCDVASFRAGRLDFDFDDPPANSGAHLNLRDSLIDRLESFTGATMQPFCPLPPEQLGIV